MAIAIRRATERDFDSMWPIFRDVVATGETYPFVPDTPREEAHDYWLGKGATTFVAEDAGRVVGMYKIVQNQRGLGSHVANASFMVDPASSGKGIGRLMGEHCLAEARKLGYQAMQFNFVVSTNAPAVALWKKLGFAIIGTVPKAFRHATMGYVDTYVMYRSLEQ